jgi:hypothetical protein
MIKEEQDLEDQFPCPMDLSYTINGTRVSKCRKVVADQKKQDDLVIDIISIGSKHRLHYLEGQYSSWASHPSIRNFVGITEDDDVDPYCELNMTSAKLRDHNDVCRRKHRQPFYLLYRYMPMTFLTRHKANPFGWLCAQVRPGSGLGKIARYYKTLESSELPDYLLLVDDDTMIRMDTFVEEMKNYDSSNARVWAGCLTLKSRINDYRFSPIGGAGTYFSKGALQRFLTPMHCAANRDKIPPSDLEFTDRMCKAMRNNRYHERPFQEEGLTLMEHANVYFNRWPNCFVSDWLVGHYVHYYQLGDIWHDLIPNRTESRLHPYLRSFIFLDDFKDLEMIPNVGQGCKCNEACANSSQPICHYVGPDVMKIFSLDWL